MKVGRNVKVDQRIKVDEDVKAVKVDQNAK